MRQTGNLPHLVMEDQNTMHNEVGYARHLAKTADEHENENL